MKNQIIKNDLKIFTKKFNKFFKTKLGKDKKKTFIQFITFGLFGAATVFTYVPKDTAPLTIISAIVVFWVILFVIYRLFQYFKLL